VEKTSSLLTVAQSSVNLQLIPDSSVFQTGSAFSFLVVTQTPDNKPVDANIDTTITIATANLMLSRPINKS